MRCTVLAVAVSLAAPPAGAQVDEIVTAKLDGHGIAALVTRQESAKVFKHGIAIFPGHPGILKLHDETLVAVLDAPSDQWASFSQDFRATPRYGSDIAAVLNEVSKLYPVTEWSFVGTSA